MSKSFFNFNTELITTFLGKESSEEKKKVEHDVEYSKTYYCEDDQYAFVKGVLIDNCLPCPMFAICVEGNATCQKGYKLMAGRCETENEASSVKESLHDNILEVLKIQLGEYECGLTFTTWVPLEVIKKNVQSKFQHKDFSFDVLFDEWLCEVRAGVKNNVVINDHVQTITLLTEDMVMKGND
eukprot:UN29986